MHLGCSYGKTPIADSRGRCLWSLTDNARGTVDGEVYSGLKTAGSNHGHDRHHRLSHHSAVPHHTRFGLTANQLWGCATRNQRVKATDRATCDGDECEGKYISCEHRARAVNKSGERRHVQCRTKGDNA